MKKYNRNASKAVPVQKIASKVSVSRGIKPRANRIETLPADLLDLDLLDWFIVQVTSGKEPHVRTLLRTMGFGTCLPIRRVYQRFTRYRKTVKMVPYAVLPGYLFIGMGKDTPGWPDLMMLSDVRSVVGTNGAPFQIDKCVVDHIAGQYESLYYPLEPEQRHNGKKPNFSVRDKVRVVAGPFDGHVVTVKKIEQSQAIVLVRMFGGDMPIAMRIDDLRSRRG